MIKNMFTCMHMSIKLPQSLMTDKKFLTLAHSQNSTIGPYRPPDHSSEARKYILSNGYSWLISSFQKAGHANFRSNCTSTCTWSSSLDLILASCNITNRRTMGGWQVLSQQSQLYSFADLCNCLFLNSSVEKREEEWSHWWATAPLLFNIVAERWLSWIYCRW